MTQENFNNIVELFKKRYYIINNNSPKISAKKAEEQIEMLEMGIKIDYKNPWNWILEFFNINEEIISYFDNINKEWCKKYHYNKINFPNKGTKFPDIFMDFKIYTDKLIEEDYYECKKIKENIIIKYE